MTSPHGSLPVSPELLAAYFDGECEGRDDLSELKLRIEAHLAANPRAREELAEYRRLFHVWQQTTPAEPAPAVWTAMLQRLETIGRGNASSWGRARVRRSMLIGASFIMAACLAMFMMLRPAPERPQFNAPIPRFVQAQPDDEVLPVAETREVTIVRVEGADTQTLVVGELPVQGMLELAAPGDVVLTRIRPDATDNMVPQVQMNETSTPLIWAKLESELD